MDDIRNVNNEKPNAEEGRQFWSNKINSIT